MGPSALLKQEIITALRMGAVPARGLEHFAVGIDLFADALAEERQRAALFLSLPNQELQRAG